MKNNIKRLDCSKEIKEWILFLVKDEKEFKVLMELYKRKGIWGSTIMEYRKLMRENGRGTIDNQKICTAYHENNIEELKKLLSEKCLENLSSETIEHFLIRVKKQNWTIEKVLTKIDRRPNGRLLSFA